MLYDILIKNRHHLSTIFVVLGYYLGNYFDAFRLLKQLFLFYFFCGNPASATNTKKKKKKKKFFKYAYFYIWGCIPGQKNIHYEHRKVFSYPRMSRQKTVVATFNYFINQSFKQSTTRRTNRSRPFVDLRLIQHNTPSFSKSKNLCNLET